VLFTQDLTNGVTYTLSGFTAGYPMPYAQIAQQNTPCFTAGTLIDTPTGAKPVETLRTGDLVHTLHHGPQSIRWIGKKAIKLAPNFSQDNSDLYKFPSVLWDRGYRTSPYAYPVNIVSWCHRR
jgi:hypothetical protein